MGDINYDVAAVVLIALNLFIFYFRRRPAGTRMRAFALILWLSMASAILDILSVLMNRGAASLSPWSLQLVNGLYYLTQNSLAPGFCVYVLALTGEWEYLVRGRRLLLALPWAAAVALILANPLSAWLFRFGPRGEYLHGPALPALYLIALGYIAFGTARALACRKALSRMTIRALLAFVLLSLIPIILQFFFPDLLLQCLGIAVFEFFILATVEDPDEHMEAATGLGTRSALARSLALWTFRGKAWRLALVSVESQSFIKHGLGLQAFARIMALVGRHIRSLAGKRGFAARLGEGSFALALPEAEGEDRLEGLLLGLQDRFRQPWSLDDEPLALSARFCSLRIPQDVPDAPSLFQAAEILERRAQAGPKGRVLQAADLGMSDSRREAEVEMALERGLAQGGFTLVYQPIVSAASGLTVSAEALVRYSDERLGPIGPDEFIPVAERSGSIHGIGALVLDRACAFIQEERLWERGIDWVEINLSVAECVRDGLADRVRRVAERYGLQASRVCLEVTETAAADSPQALERNLRELADSGFALALDDFGTGWSNINYLADLPFAYVKLDRSVVQAAFKTVRGRITLEGSLAMCRRMGLRTVAEGVETEAQARELRDQGCDFFQGYFFSRPLPGPQFLGLGAGLP